MNWIDTVVEPGLTFAVAISTVLFGAGAFLDTFGSDDAKAGARRYIENPTRNVYRLWNDIVTSIFGEKIFSLRAVLASVIISIVICSTFMAVYVLSSSWCIQFYAQLDTWLRLLVIILLINGVGDFLSLCKSRLLIAHVSARTPPPYLLIFYFLIDFVLGIAIFYFCMSIITGVFYLFTLDFSSFLSYYSIDSQVRMFQELTGELLNYGIFLKATNTFSLGAYFYSTLTLTIWSLAFYLPAAALSVPRTIALAEKYWLKVMNTRKHAIMFAWLNIGSLVFVFSFFAYVIVFTILFVSGHGVGANVEFRCQERLQNP